MLGVWRYSLIGKQYLVPFRVRMRHMVYGIDGNSARICRAHVAHYGDGVYERWMLANSKVLERPLARVLAASDEESWFRCRSSSCWLVFSVGLFQR